MCTRRTPTEDRCNSLQLGAVDLEEVLLDGHVGSIVVEPESQKQTVRNDSTFTSVYYPFDASKKSLVSARVHASADAVANECVTDLTLEASP